MIFGKKTHTVKIQDAELIFRDLTKDEYLDWNNLFSKEITALTVYDMLNFSLPLLVEIKNAIGPDGKTLNADQFKSLEFSHGEARQIVIGFNKSIFADINQEAAKDKAEKND